MSQRHEALLGRTLARTYVVERLLGKGGMGAVYAARHLRTGGACAVKVLDREAAAEEEIYRRFQNEARIVSALRHPHIVQVTDFDQDDDGTPFLVMELLEGEDLQHRLRQRGRLPLTAVLELAQQVGSALHAAHKNGVVHRDVKPQNVFLCRHQLTEQTIETAKVVDFGISKIRSAGFKTQDRTVLGTPFYMSPEAAQARNADLDGRADQWGLAVILYRALAGRLPFDNPDPIAVLYQVVNRPHTPLGQAVPELPPPVAQAIDCAMSKRREDRFPSMADFLRALGGRSSLSPGPLSIAPPAPEVVEEYDSIELLHSDTLAQAGEQRPRGLRPLPARRFHPGRIALYAALATALLTLGVLGLWQRRRPPPGEPAPLRIAETRPPSLSAVAVPLVPVTPPDLGAPAQPIAPAPEVQPAPVEVVKPQPLKARKPRKHEALDTDI